MWPDFKYISIGRTRIVDLRWVNISPYNFVVREPNFIYFLLFNGRCMSLNKTVYQILIFLSILEIFAVKVENCPKSRQILDIFCFSVIKRAVPPKSCIRLITPI